MKDGNLVVRSGTNCPDGSIVSFGDLQMDIARIKDCRSPAEVPGFLEAPGGAPANVAIAVARLGGKAAFVGKLDDKEVGPMLARTLGENYVRTLSAQGGEMLPLIRSGSAKVFHYGSINLIGEPCKEAHLEAMMVAKDAGLLLSYDPNLQLQLWPSLEKAREQIMSIWDLADLIKVSDVEFEFLIGSNEIDDESAMSTFFPNLKLLLVFLEDLSCRYYTKNFRGEVEAFRVDTVDTTGAGDSFVGALLCKIVDDQSILEDEPKLRDVLKFANACAAFTTTKKGAVLAFPTKNDALGLIRGA